MAAGTAAAMAGKVLASKLCYFRGWKLKARIFEGNSLKIQAVQV
jgi:hypothetical protein